MADNALAAWLRLTLIPGIGTQIQRRLLSHFGLPHEIFNADRNAVRAIIGDRLANMLFNTDNAAGIERALAFADGEGQYIFTLGDPEYPKRLLEISDPPSLIYVRGNPALLNQNSLAVVGSRNPTPQGVRDAENFSAYLAEKGVVITSGLALGIDAAAHRGALSVGGGTIAFIGTGIDQIYPVRNQALAQQIAASGCIVSEFPIGTPVTASNFPRRNRLISGSSCGVLVIEAAIESGSLITARLGAEQGREVFAIPGSIHSPVARGCHKLIKQGAKLVERAADILEEFKWNTPLNTAPTDAIAEESRETTPPTDTNAEDPILKHLGFHPATLDELVKRSGLSANLVASRLLALELQGAIATLPGGRYQRLSKK